MAEGRNRKKPIPYWLKKAVTGRDGCVCQICGKIGNKDKPVSLAYEYKGYVDFDGTIPKPVRFEFDHIIPESLGGPTEINNLQLACRNCNRSKGNRIGTETNVVEKDFAVQKS